MDTFSGKSDEEIITYLLNHEDLEPEDFDAVLKKIYGGNKKLARLIVSHDAKMPTHRVIMSIAKEKAATLKL